METTLLRGGGQVPVSRGAASAVEMRPKDEVLLLTSTTATCCSLPSAEVGMAHEVILLMVEAADSNTQKG